MPEENKTPDKCCDKCRHDVNTCTRRPCNIANNYDLFEPKVKADLKNPNWRIDHFTYSKKDDYMIFTLESETNGTMLVELTPDEIASFANNH